MTDKELRRFTIMVPLSYTEIKYMHDNLKAECQNEETLHLFINIAQALTLNPVDLFKQVLQMESAT